MPTEMGAADMAQYVAYSEGCGGGEGPGGGAKVAESPKNAAYTTLRVGIDAG